MLAPLALVSALVATAAAGLLPVPTSKTLPYKFTLAALNTTHHNANLTGTPLVLGQAGASTGIAFEVTSTWASYPYNTYPLQGLHGGILRAFDAEGTWTSNATEPAAGAFLQWLSSQAGGPAAPTVFSAVQPLGALFPELALHGRADRWSLCPPAAGYVQQTNIVYDVAADIPVTNPYLGFDPATCYPVKVQLIPHLF